MAGNAVTSDFMLGTATVLMGAQADLMDLNPATHSIGLVKNFTITSQPNYVELTQGVKNTIVDSQMNANPIRATMEAYEFTAKNLAYGLGLDGSGITPQTVKSTVLTPVTGDGDTTDTVVLAAAGGTSFAGGDTIAIEHDTDDGVLVRKIVSKSTDTLTLDYPIPEGFNISTGDIVRKCNIVDMGSKTNQPYLSARIIGVLGNGTRVNLLLPKLRLVKGFSMAFATQNYGNLPFEFTLYDLVSTDGFYSYFGGSTGRIVRN